jgi:hypothetical protein
MASDWQTVTYRRVPVVPFPSDAAAAFGRKNNIRNRGHQHVFSEVAKNAFSSTHSTASFDVFSHKQNTFDETASHAFGKKSGRRFHSEYSTPAESALEVMRRKAAQTAILEQEARDKDTTNRESWPEMATTTTEKKKSATTMNFAEIARKRKEADEAIAEAKRIEDEKKTKLKQAYEAEREALKLVAGPRIRLHQYSTCEYFQETNDDHIEDDDGYSSVEEGGGEEELYDVDELAENERKEEFNAHLFHRY